MSWSGVTRASRPALNAPHNESRFCCGGDAPGTDAEVLSNGGRPDPLRNTVELPLESDGGRVNVDPARPAGSSKRLLASVLNRPATRGNDLVDRLHERSRPHRQLLGAGV